MSRKKFTPTMSSSDAVNADDRSSGDDGTPFTIVSYQRSRAPSSTACAPARANSSKLQQGKNEIKESQDTSSIRTRGSVTKNRTLVTITTFGAFHYRIFPLI